LDENGRRFRKQRNFKVYLTNPSLRAGLFGPANEDSPEFGALVETAICAQLFHSPNFRNYSYGRWHKEEIDFVYSDPATWKPLQAFEVKWSDRTEEWQKAAKAICRFLSKNGIQHDYHTCVTTKSTMGQVAYDSKEIVLLPTAWHCWYLGRIASGDRTIDMLEKLERDVRSEKHSLLALLANKQ
jgi:hypothetical protein